MPPSILIVDDEQSVRHVLRRKFENCGYNVREAADGNEALQTLANAPADLVITDIIMPEKDGLETICYLRRQHPQIKIIAMSAPSNQLYLSSACGLGAARAFEKPLKLEDLANAVADLIGSANQS